jgi:hypothetical protein
MTLKRRRGKKSRGNIVIADLSTARQIADDVRVLHVVVREIREEWSALVKEQAQCLEMLARLGELHRAAKELTDQLKAEADRRSDAARRANRKRHKPILPDAPVPDHVVESLVGTNEWSEDDQVTLSEIGMDDFCEDTATVDMNSRQGTAAAAGP